MSDQRFLVTARKYRPLLFDELVAQEHVTGTLKNALTLDRLAHAYLFTGPRGVGKTTAARILAKAINCTTPQEDRPGGAEPCRTCDSCKSFEEGRNLNIIEIDAASNNKVDDVRDLRETVRIPPQGNRKKVYIVDEVHMLTNQAFNALLKTLEEPPPHVLFIFATTEPHKVLPTIQSRCQRFDFRRIPVDEIVGRLETICQAESVTADDGSLMLIARKGDGALRDALSVFDQAVSLCGTTLEHAALVEALGVVSEEYFFRVTDHVASRNVAGMLELVDEVVGSGYDLQEFLDGLAEHLRNLLVARTMPDTALIEASEASRKRYADLSGGFSETQIMRMLAGVDETMDGLRAARHPRLRLELALVRMASRPATTDIKAALRQVRELAGKPRGESPKPQAASPPPKVEAKPPPVKAAATQPDPAEAKPPPPKPTESEAAPPTPAPTSVESAPSEAAPPTPAPTSVESPAPAPTSVESPAPAPPAVESPAPAPTSVKTLFGSTGSGANIFGTPALKRIDPSPDTSSGPQDVAVLEAPPPATEAPEGWETVVERVMTAKIHLGAFLHHAQPEIRDPQVLTLLVPDDFHARVLKDAASEILAGMKESGHEQITRIDFDVNGLVQSESDVPQEIVDPRKALERLCEEYPAMALLMERFGGEIVW